MIKSFKTSHLIFWSILFILVIWLCGFAFFIWDAMTFSSALPQAEGIVVLTGGAKRIDTAIQLLQEKRARYLLISGVSTQTTLEDLEKNLATKLSSDEKKRITLGYSATSTMGNAIETAAWVNSHELKSLIIVTSSYHMRRAIVEMRNMISDIPMYPYIVQQQSDTLNNLHLYSLRLLFLEYNKYIAAYIGFIHTTRPKQDLFNLPQPQSVNP